MRKRWTALLLALSMLLCAGCGGGEQQTTKDPLPKPDMEVIRSDPQPKEDDTAAPVDETPQEPEIEVLAWATDPVLSAGEMPGNYYGLELPVRGATGYTSVELPLWEAPEDYMTAQETFDAWEEQRAAEAAAAEQDPEPILPEEGPAAPQDGAPQDGGTVAQDSITSDSGISASLDVISFWLKAPEEGDPLSEGAPLPEGEAGPAGDAPAGEETPSDDTPVTDGETPADPVDEPPAAPGEDAADPAQPTDPGQDPTASDPAVTQPEDPGQTQPETGSQLPGEGETAPQEGVFDPFAEPEVPAEPPTRTDGALAILPPGTPMTILDESDQWWRVRCTASYTSPEGNTVEGEVIGWVEHRYCLINLPDVIPSIIYNATNGYSSKFISCGKNIDGITGEQLYTGKTFNRRFGEEEFMMPVLYSMSFLLCKAQRAALEEGNSLILYEGYRPLETQLKVANGLRALMKADKEVKTAITTPPWSIPWFIATSASNHQWGYAVDMSLARVKEVDVRQTGEYIYTRVIDYEEYAMPTPIHELSPAAATFTTAIGPNSTTAWKKAKLTDTFAACEPALGMQRYCTNVGLSPLASEWWHFNDLASRASILDNPSSAGFEITACLSEGPYRNIT